MRTRILTIVGKQRPHPLALVSLDDFQYQEDEAIDPLVVLTQPTISLYCVEPVTQQAIFVETAPSEPDVYTQLLTRRAADGSHDPELRALIRSCTLVMCASTARSRGASAWALKFRSFVIELGDLLYDNFPEAKVIFLYRHAEAWAQSVARAFRVFDPQIGPLLSALQPLFPRGIPTVVEHTEQDPAPLSPLALVTYLWVSVMERCLDLQRQGVPMFVLRYEDLQATPHAVLDALLAYCGVAASDVGGIDRVLAQDSQAGTSLSREDVQASTSELGAHHIAELHQLMRAYSPILTPDFVVPQTFRRSWGSG